THAEPAIPGGPDDAKVARIAHAWGAGSAYYRAHILGVFPEGTEEGLIRARSWLERAAARAATAPPATDSTQPSLAADLARAGGRRLRQQRERELLGPAHGVGAGHAWVAR